MLKRYCNMCDKSLKEDEKRHAVEVQEQYDLPVEEGEQVPEVATKHSPEGQKRMVSKYNLDVCDSCFQETLAKFSLKAKK